MKINCDLGERDEHWSHDEKLIPLVDQVNISCGAHAGSIELIFKTIERARDLNKSIGMHPAYPDKANFGRVSLTLSDHQLQDSLERQIEFFLGLCSSLDVKPAYVKPHGALYHDCLSVGIFKTLLKSMESFELKIPVLLLRKPKDLDNDVLLWNEAFLDRRYESQNKLRARENNGVIQSAEEAFAQYISISKDSRVKLAKGGFAEVRAKSACVHGDSPIALELLEKINKYRGSSIY